MSREFARRKFRGAKSRRRRRSHRQGSAVLAAARWSTGARCMRQGHDARPRDTPRPRAGVVAAVGGGATQLSINIFTDARENTKVRAVKLRTYMPAVGPGSTGGFPREVAETPGTGDIPAFGNDRIGRTIASIYILGRGDSLSRARRYFETLETNRRRDRPHNVINFNCNLQDGS